MNPPLKSEQFIDIKPLGFPINKYIQSCRVDRRAKPLAMGARVAHSITSS